MMERSSRTAGSADADAATRRVRTGSLLAVVTFGTAALAALVVALGTVVVGRLDAATDVNALVAEARRQADSVDELGAEVVLRAREQAGPLNSPVLLERRGDVLEDEIELIRDRAAAIGQETALLGTDARADRLVDAIRGMVQAGSDALASDEIGDEATRAEAEALLDVFYRLFRHDLSELEETLTQLESASIREQTEGINTFSRWILVAAGVSMAIVLVAGLSARKVAKRERSLMALLGRRATEDALTSLLNRRGFTDEFQRALESRTADEQMALLFLDLDGFKQVNDTLGHQCGDVLLKTVAARISSGTRPTDLVGRLGGDEFAILLRWTSPLGDVDVMAHRLREAIMRPVELDDQSVSVGVSVGIRSIGRHEERADELLRDADVAMYDAKRARDEGIRRFDDGLVDALRSRLTMEQALERAVRQEELSIAYQPIFSVGGELVGAEALVRWEHEGAMVRPDDFLPLATDLGLMPEIDDQVMRRATADIAELNQRYGLQLNVAVNVAAEEFDTDDLCRRIGAALEASRLPAERLIVEITEQSALRSVDRATEVLQGVRRLGVAVALDDFGTGHSALHYLEQLPIDILKIDRSFMPDNDGGLRRYELFRAVVELGRRLGFGVVAEGIETVAQQKLARDAGCTELQGYLLGRPGPIDQLTQLAADQQMVSNVAK